jgi:hypothetical protein
MLHHRKTLSTICQMHHKTLVPHAETFFSGHPNRPQEFICDITRSLLILALKPILFFYIGMYDRGFNVMRQWPVGRTTFTLEWRCRFRSFNTWHILGGSVIHLAEHGWMFHPMGPWH